MSQPVSRSGAEPLVIGIDVGGTKVLAGEVDAEGRVVRTAQLTTPGRRGKVSILEDTLTAALEQVAAGREVDAVGLAAAGFVDAAGERVMFAPHLPWVEAPVRDRLEERWDVPVVLENDATAAAIAEATYGAARGLDDVLMITLGTGIGGGVVIGGRLHRGANGMAGEFGHMQVVPGGRSCECGGNGCWEQYCSGNALVRHARAGIGTRPSLLEEFCDGDPELLTGPMVTRGGKEGDPLALEAFADIGEWLGIGAANLAAAFDPACLVVGGGVSAAGELLLGPGRSALESSLVGSGHRDQPPLVAAVLGPQAGLIGAAALTTTNSRQ